MKPRPHGLCPAYARLLPAILLCVGALAASGCPRAGVRDHDGDGYDSVDDCNDSNPATHPGATEICDDQLDNDCDLAVDAADTDCAP